MWRANEVRTRDRSIEGRVTGKRPHGSHSDGSANATYGQRKLFILEQLKAERELNEVREELAALDAEMAPLRKELQALERAMVTSDSLTDEITAHNQARSDMEAEP